jgi:tol-pal system protein YbgF
MNKMRAHSYGQGTRRCLLIHVWAFVVLAVILMSKPVLAQVTEGDRPAAETAASSAPIEARLRRIEDTLIDMRAMIGALESLARSGEPIGAPAPLTGSPRAATRDYAGAPGDDGQLETLELQVRALAAQLAEVIQRLRSVEAASGLASPADTGLAQPGSTESQLSGPFSSTTLEPDLADDPAAREASPDALWAAAEEPPASRAQASTPEAQALYTQAYDAMRARDYATAQRDFGAFLQRYPDDALALSAQYWLGEADFVSGDYVGAANHFVKVYNSDPYGENSAETLLKLGISLRRLDRVAAACDALQRLAERGASLAGNMRERLEREQSRAGC